MAKMILAVVIRKDAFLFAEAPQSITIDCENAKLIDLAWAKPVLHNSLVVDYQKILVAPSKPSIDSIRVAIIETADGSQYWVVIPDNGVYATFTDKCNACCGSTPVMPAVTIYPPVQEICPCLDANGTTRTFSWPLPYNPNTLAMMLAGTFDGVAGTPAYGGAGLANAAAVLSYLTTNWSAYGTWTLQNSSTVIRLVTSTVLCASLSIPLVPATYCFSFPTGSTTVDSIVIGANTVLFPGGPITFTSADPTGLQFILSQLLVGTISTQLGSPSKLTYTGLQVPVKLQNAGVDVAGTTFTAGVCSWTHEVAVPTDIGSYTATQPSFNGVVGVPDLTAQSWTTAALMLTWFQTNMAAYGTWSLQSGNTILRLVSTTTYTMTNLVITSA